MQNHLILEELRLLQQRRQQQQQDLLQQQLQRLATAAGGGQYPLLSSALLGTAMAAPAPAPVKPDALLWRDVQQLRNGGGQATDVVNAANGSFAGGGWSNEELLRKLAAAGLLGSVSQNPPPPPSLPSLLQSIVAAELDRKRDASATFPPVMVTPQEDLQFGLPPRSVKRQRVENEDYTDPAAAAALVLASVVDMETKQRILDDIAAKNRRSRGNSFLLPPASEKDLNAKREGMLGMPNLTSFRKVWDDVKTKGMQKEIFLRKLHAGKMMTSSSSASKVRDQQGCPVSHQAV